MKLLHLALLSSIFINTLSAAEAKERKMEEKVIRQYIFVPKKIDPAHILTMAELDISMAISSTLVEWDDSRQPVAGLSEKWEVPSSNIIRFKLRHGLKWSNGDKITANEVCRSFERAKTKYLDELSSLFDVIKEFRCPDDRTVEFETKVSIADSNILRKITEPMYGLVDTDKNGEISLKRSSGAFIIESSNANEVRLKKNTNWYKNTDNIADRVELKQQPENSTPVLDFAADKWVNFLTTNSLLSEKVMNDFKKSNYEVWQRSFDKIFFLAPSKKFVNEFGSGALKSIGNNIQIEALLPQASGFSKTAQFFPRGYVLHSQNFNTGDIAKLPIFKRSLKILLPLTPSGLVVKETLPKEIERITGQKPTVSLVKPNEISEAKAKGDYDIIAVNVAVDDPNFEGAMAFFFAGNAPLIQSGTGENDFVGRIAKTKTLQTDPERVAEMRSIISKATIEGYVAPLFHFASMTVAKGLDLSKVPKTKETIPFSQIGFR